MKKASSRNIHTEAPPPPNAHDMPEFELTMVQNFMQSTEKKSTMVSKPQSIKF